jgi:hypothetical protein
VWIPRFAYRRKEPLVIHTEKPLSTPFLTIKINVLCFFIPPRGSKTSLQVYFYLGVGNLLISFYKPVFYAARVAPHTRPW